MDRPRVLVVQHQDDCPPGHLSAWLAAAGVEQHVVRPDRGELLRVTPHDGVVVLGGSPNAHDDRAAPWLPAVRGLASDCLADDVPLLGICLGHQLIAAALGARSAPNPHGQQIGVLGMGWAEAAAADPVLGSLPPSAVQWNDDVVTGLPPSAAVLAATASGEVQAVRYGRRAWGVQCHPEADAAICSGWAEHDRQRHARAGRDVDRYLDAVRAADADLAAAWQPVATAFADLVTRAAVDSRR